MSVGEPVTSVALETGVITGNRRDRSFLVGTEKGRLIYHKPARFSQKDALLFPGDGTPVISIAWKGNYVAWADVCVVRVMDVSTQTAICQLQPPYGVGIEDPFPCSLFWRNERELMVGWADSCKIVRIEDAGNDVLSSSTSNKVARTIVSWQTDCIICGLFPLDDEHVIFLGYTPPEESEFLGEEEVNPDESMDSSLPRNVTNEPEMIIAKAKTGDIVCADVLSLKGVNLKGPFAYSLLTSYQCQNNSLDASKWQLKNYQQTRGGDRGNAPLLFVVSSEDVIVARVRDVNDRVRVALEQKNLKLAVDIAKDDRNSFKLYQYSDLLNLYLEHLLDRNMLSDAAAECARLIGPDQQLWDTWIQRFIEHRAVITLCPHIPVDVSRRLSLSSYEKVLTDLLSKQPKHFLEAVKMWSKVKPALFDHKNMIDRLQSLTNSRLSSSLQYLEEEEEEVEGGGGESVGGGKDHSGFLRGNKSYYLAALAHLYLLSNQHEKALNAYLQMNINTSASSSVDEKGGVTNVDREVMSEYRQIFELIEKESLFSAIENKIINLIQISKDLSGKLLLNNVDKLPIKQVASQLSVDARLLFWYLHLVFSDPTTRELYADVEQFEDLHRRQVKLYTEFAPSPSYLSKSQTNTSSPSEEAVNDVRSTEAIERRKRIFESDFITFMKSGLADLQQCLQECQTHTPHPLYAEMIFIYSVRGERRKALNLLLREIGDISLAIDVIEDQFDSIMLVEGGVKRQGTRFASAPIQQQSQSYITPGSSLNNEELWNDVIHFALDRPEFLPDLFDNLGVSRLDSEKVLRSLKPHLQIPLLRQRMVRMFRELVFKDDLFLSSKAILGDDALNLLRQKNHGQRRAIKIDSKQIRCSACLRLLSMDAGPLSSSQSNYLLPSEKSQILIWGPKNRPNAASMSVLSSEKSSASRSQQLCHDSGTVIFSNKLAFHRVCYDRISNG